jgi:predicted DNA-binding protein with PD1-like motif
VPCRAEPFAPRLESGADLVPALGALAKSDGFGSAVLDLSGLVLGPFDYVMPDRAIDDRHVAWYSDTHSSAGAKLEAAVAILGWREGSWFAHIHAFWHENGHDRLGHLLPASVKTGASAQLEGYGLKGAVFKAAPDPETEFTLFRVHPDPATASEKPDNALITTLAPFADLHVSVSELSDKLDTKTYDVLGLGSLAGAAFQDDRPMTGLISEILLLPGAGTGKTPNLTLPVRCVDLDGNLHAGAVLPGKAPTLVTCELLIRNSDNTALPGSHSDIPPISDATAGLEQ